MNPLQAIRGKALALLARREHSEAELLQKLQHRNFPLADIHTVLKILRDENLLSNERFIIQYIYSRKGRGYGPLRIRQELITRGIPENLIEAHLLIDDNAWRVTIKTVWRKRFKNHLPDNFKNRCMQQRFLQYRGFTREQINSIFTTVDEME